MKYTNKIAYIDFKDFIYLFYLRERERGGRAVGGEEENLKQILC